MLAEAAYRDLVKLINAAAIMEIPADLDYSIAIDRLNAEVEHYKQIIARKGSSSGGEDEGGDEAEPTPEPEPTPVEPENPSEPTE